MTIRLAGICDMAAELEKRIEATKPRKEVVELEGVTINNIYKILKSF